MDGRRISPPGFQRSLDQSKEEIIYHMSDGPIMSHRNNIKECWRQQIIHGAHILGKPVQDPTNRVGVEESAGSSEDSAEHGVMEFD